MVYQTFTCKNDQVPVNLHAVSEKMTTSKKSYLLLFSMSFSVACSIPIFTQYNFR